MFVHAWCCAVVSCWLMICWCTTAHWRRRKPTQPRHITPSSSPTTASCDTRNVTLRSGATHVVIVDHPTGAAVTRFCHNKNDDCVTYTRVCCRRHVDEQDVQLMNDREVVAMYVQPHKQQNKQVDQSKSDVNRLLKSCHIEQSVCITFYNEHLLSLQQSDRRPASQLMCRSEDSSILVEARTKT